VFFIFINKKIVSISGLLAAGSGSEPLPVGGGVAREPFRCQQKSDWALITEKKGRKDEDWRDPAPMITYHGIPRKKKPFSNKPLHV